MLLLDFTELLLDIDEDDLAELLLESSFLTEELLLSSSTELEEFLVATEELDSFVFSTDEEDSSLGSGAGAELLDSSPQATNKTAESNNAAKYFTENLLKPQEFRQSKFNFLPHGL
jgi:hypothetical protein